MIDSMHLKAVHMHIVIDDAVSYPILPLVRAVAGTTQPKRRLRCKSAPGKKRLKNINALGSCGKYGAWQIIALARSFRVATCQ